MRKLFVFDLDDTLIDNMHDYAEPIVNAAMLIIKTLGNRAPHVSKIIAMEQEIDTRRVKEINPTTGKPHLWSMERFPGSLVEVYREICAASKIEPQKQIEETLYAIGLSAFDEKRYAAQINPHTKEVLDFLKAEGDTLILCTKGDTRVQEKKCAALLGANALTQFSDLLVVDEKTPELFRTISKNYPGLAPYSVGNSYQSDIVPALYAGFRGIYIPVETWDTIGKIGEIRSKIDWSRCIELKNLRELKNRYGELK